MDATDDHVGKAVYPGSVVHQRGIHNNLLAVEVRKSSNHQPPEHDRHKLRGLTDPHLWFAYRIGVLLTLAKKNVAASDVYVGESATISSAEQARLLGEAWERAVMPDIQVRLVVFHLTGRYDLYPIGPHAPELCPRDFELIHTL